MYEILRSRQGREGKQSKMRKTTENAKKAKLCEYVAKCGFILSIRRLLTNMRLT